MPLIIDNIDREFADARRAVGGNLHRMSHTVPQLPERRLPKISSERAMALRGAGTTYAHGQSAMMKTAFGSPAQTGADTKFTAPEIRNPLLNLINFYLPYDRKTLNQWIRYYDRFHPYVGNCIDLHGEFPISDFHFTGIADKKILDIYEEQKEKADLLQYCFEASREYELIGEVHSFWNWNEDDLIWSDYVVLNPDLLDIQSLNWGQGAKTIYVYDPPQELKDLINSREDYAQELINSLDDVVRENLISGKKIPLNDFNVMSLIRRASPYESRGTSIVLRIIKDLMYEDKLREAQYAIADQQITPVQLWKLGDPASGYMPNETDLQDFRNLLMAGNHDPIFTIVSHAAVNLDLIGYTGKLLPVIPEFDFVAKRVMVGLFTSEAMITGQGPTYANAVVAMKALQGRYQAKRDRIEKSFKRTLFEPLAKARKLFEPTTADVSHNVKTSKGRKLIVPGIEWNFKLDLTDQTQRLQYMMQLVSKSQLPVKLIAEVLDIPYDAAKEALKAEEGTVFDPIYQEARKARSAKTGMPPPQGDLGTDMDVGGGGPPGEGGGTGEESGGEEFLETPPPGA